MSTDTELTTVMLDVSGMDCAGCARKIDQALRAIRGVRDVSLHYPDTTLGVLHGGDVSPAAIRSAVEALGFGVGPARGF